MGCVLGRYFHIFCNICSLWDSFSFTYFHPDLYLCGCGTCMMWSVFFELGVTVIAAWTGKESIKCAVFIFIFVYATLFSMLGPHFPWLWRRLRSPCRCLTGTLVMVDVAQIVGASSSHD